MRKTHCAGRKHKENVKAYYQKWMEDQAQSLIDATTAAFKSGQLLKTPPAHNGLGSLPSLVPESSPVLALPAADHPMSLVGPPPGLPPGALQPPGLPPAGAALPPGLPPGALQPHPHLFSHSLPPLLSPHPGFFGPLFHPAFRPPMGLVIFRPHM